MSAAITLPSLLRTRLAAIQRRIRLLRAVRGLALLVLVLALSAAAAGLADYWLDLPALARQIFFGVWLAEGMVLLLLGIVVPLGRRIDAASLAAVIEEKYPDLGERLTSAVALAGTDDEGHGSPLFIALLLEETAERSAPLDFRPAASACRAGILAALAAVVALLVAAPAFVRPRQYGDLAQRFFRPWDIAPAAAPYNIAVSPGDAIAARGRSLTLSAHVTPRNEKIVLPDAATLLVVEADGKETRQAMPRADNGDFTLAYNVSGDVSYRIEAGEVVSDSYRVTTIAPVELADESPRITIKPPAYARAVKDEETFHGLVDLSPLQHSEIRFDFRFTRPAVVAYLELGDNVVRHPLTLSADRQEASVTITANGRRQPAGRDSHQPAGRDSHQPADAGRSLCPYRLVLEAEHAIRTELAGGTIRVQPDQPPSVLRFAGKEELRSVLPYERIPLEIEAADDIGVAGVELEYRINDGEAVRQPLDLQRGNAASAVARHVVELAGKVKEDDRFSYRFHVRDNLPKQYEGPHVIVYPADRWRTLRIARRGDPLAQRDILAQRDDIHRRLQAIREALIQEGRGVFKVRQETRLRPALSPDKLQRVKQLEDDNRTSRKALRDVAEIADAAPALQPIAERARDVADREMDKSQQALEQAARQPAPALRNHQFETADEQIDSAVKRLEELQKTNDRLAQERLDQAKLETLADREKRLAEQAAELASKHPVLDPKARELAEKIKREQAEAAQELERLAQQSEPLKQGLEQARQEQAQRMAERARELAQAQRDLARAETKTERQRQADRFAELLRRQQELAERQAKLARETRSSAPVAQTAPLKPEESQRAAEALKQGNTPEAVRRQEQAANDLERLAQAFERAVKVSADPKEAARQLEHAEKALRQRVQEETARKDNKQPLSERLRPLEAEQKAIRRAAEQLSVPPKHTEANKLKEQIGERAARAAEALQKQDAAQARARMDETRNLLHRLSDLLPNLDQRRQHAYREMERLRRHQEEIARQVEQLKKDDVSTAQRLAEAARRQAESAKALSKMDAPNQEERRQRTTDALHRALADLLDGRREDAPASQQEAKRQLERLDQALRGEKPADERAREDAAAKANDIARRQRALADETAKAETNKASPEESKRAADRQADLARQLRRLNGKDALPRMVETRLRMADAALALERAKSPVEAKRAVARAAESAEKLAEQLGRAAARKPAETPALAQREPQEADNAAPHSLPSKEQSEQARQLARQQRELRDAVQRAARTARGERPVVRDNPVEELAQKQAEVAQQADDLARNIGQEQGEKTPAARQAQQARQAARQAAQHVRAGALPQARQAGQQSAERLRQLAARLARTPRGDDAQTSDPLQKTRQLEQRQEEINRRLQPLADDTRAQAAQQQNQQRHLQQETGEMTRQFQQLAMQRAKDASQQAQQAMQQAREQAQRGESAAEKQSQERAAQGLDQAAQAASEPRPSGSGDPPLPDGRGSDSRSKAGEAVAQAGQQMAAAQRQLQQGQPARAQSAMKQAAQSLAQAAQQMSPNPASPQRQQGMPDQPIGLGRLPGGLPDLSAYGLEKTVHAGKSWGELPGELRTKIVQDMKTRYGDDYARMIKYYFEHIADTKKK